MPQRRLFVSDSFAVLQEAFITAVQAVKTADPLVPLTILVPSDVLGSHLRRAVARAGSGHLGLYTYTLIDFAREVAEDILIQEGWQPLSTQAAPLIIHKLLREAEPDNYFVPLAPQPRFPRDLFQTIIDLKHAGVHPQDLHTFIDQAQLAGIYRQKVSSLATLYERYTHFLAEHRLYDDNDLLERAAAVLAAPRHTDPLFFYGFYDLNFLQRRLVTAAIQDRDALMFFPWREGSAYEYATPTLTWLTSLGFQLTSLVGIPDHEGDLASVQRWLFESRLPHELSGANAPCQVPPANGLEETHVVSQLAQKLAGSVTLISVPNISREAREIGRIVLELVRNDDLCFHDIAILLRDPTTYGALITETLTGFGIPCFLHSGVPLIQTQAGQSLRLLCQVLAEDYARSRVFEFLTIANPPFAELLGDFAPHARLDRWETFSLEAGIVKGGREWRERLPRLTGNLQQDVLESEAGADDDELQSLQAFVVFMQNFITSCEEFSQSDTLQEWAEHTLRLFRTYVSPTVHTAEIEEALLNLSKLPPLGASISAKEWYRSVVAALATAGSRSSTKGRTDGAPGNSVWIGDLRAAYGVQFRAVIVPGLIEGHFPPSARQDPLLLDVERQHLSEVLLRQLPQRGHRDEEERLLFTLLVQSATERLILTYPRFNQDGGRSQVPSGYLRRIIETLSKQPVSLADLAQWVVHVPLFPFHVGPPSAAVDAIEFHLASIEQARTTGDATLLGYLPALTPFFSRAMHAAHQRWDTPTLTIFEGMIDNETVRTLLYQSLFPQGAILSPSALETYVRCPFRYFLSTVLHLTPQRYSEEISLLTPQDRGALLHDILCDFFSQLRTTGHLPLAAQDRMTLTRLLMHVAEQHCNAFARHKATGLPLLWELEQERLQEQLSLLLKWERENEHDFLPAFFEIPFGINTTNEGELFFPQTPVRFTLEDGTEIGLRGRIDRIDLSLDSQRARIIDYKTGRLVRGRFAGGTALQLPVYLFAARALRPDLLWESAEYIYIDHLNRRRKPPFTAETWTESLATLRTIVMTCVQGIRSGCFVATPFSCHSCPFSSVCGAHSESQKVLKFSDPRLEPLQKLREIL